MSSRSTAVFVVGIVLALAAHASAAPRVPRVLRVGSWHSVAGDFSSVQSAVDAAAPGDWILVGPGDYHESGDRTHPRAGHAGAAVLITTAGLHLRGMDRNAVVIDGTRPGAAACSSAPADQDFGPTNDSNQPLGRDGIVVSKVDGVSIENLTVCNFHEAAEGGGNQIWFNGGDTSGLIGMGTYYGAYLSATTSYWQPDMPQAQYGIFASNARGPGFILDSYASNMADSSYYIGACPDCNAWLLRAHAQNSALGYSGTNSGGHLVIGDSEWDHNRSGLVPNSQNNDDPPSPQDGACPNGEAGILGNGSCTYIVGNWIHDNNNPNTPAAESASLGPVGSGIVIAGGRHDTVVRNRIEHNGAWGVLLTPFPDSGTPPANAHCQGGIANPGGPLGEIGVTCFFDDFGNEVRGNFFRGNGFFGNGSNGDLAELSLQNDQGNCWHDNFDPAGVTSQPADLQVTHGRCGVPNVGDDPLESELGAQVICATQVFGPCQAVGSDPGYPQTTTVSLMPLPKQPSMPNPCNGVPANPWCKRR